MNLFLYLERQFTRLKIDMATQRTFLAGQIASIDDNNIIKTVSTNYEELEVIFFSHATLKDSDVIVDVGCGKGRVFNYLLYKGLKNKMIGYEINPLVAVKTEKNLKRFENVEIRSENIFSNFPQNGNVFYLYNPFKEAMITEFIENILKIADKDPVIFYNNPIHLKLFDNGKFIYQCLDIPVTRYGYNFQFAVIHVKRS